MTCSLPDEILERCISTYGAFFEHLSGVNRRTIAEEHLNFTKSTRRAMVLERYCKLKGKKLLEVGSGYGTNLATWIKDWGVDGYGVEKNSDGFDESLAHSRTLFSANGLDPNRLIEASGENLPFDDCTFDIVYSANVLEHVPDPLQICREALRVLRPGGIIHMEAPNFYAPLETHYWLLQPPILSRSMLVAWVRLLGRDPSFAGTIFPVNPIWARQASHQLGLEFDIELISVGGDIFLDRLRQPYQFENGRMATKLGQLVKFVQSINVGNFLGQTLVFLQLIYPIFLTIKKRS
jgi:SAM-dependent methyltransferase